MPSEEDVRLEARRWIAEHWQPSQPLGEWWDLLAESGWGFPHYPVEWFGRGLSSDAAKVVERELRDAGAFGPPHGIGTMMVAPMLLELGSDEQRRRWIPGIVRGTEVWCQLFSEPNAGSDLAGVQTKAVRDGEQWIVNGQKVWTSGGHYAVRAILLARTDPNQPKHRGLSFFVIEMGQPGVEARPLVQMTGDAEFNEVFLTDAVVPAENLIGEVNGGWGVAVRLLSYERSSLDPEAQPGIQHTLDLTVPAGKYASGDVSDSARSYVPRGREAWDVLASLLRQTGRDHDPVARQDAMRVYTYLELARFAGLRAAAAAAAGRLPGPEASLGKLASVRLLRAYRDLALRLVGAGGSLAGEDAPYHGLFTKIALGVPGSSIAGGTDEIQRNIIGERVLGLPGEPRVDKDLPFAAVPPMTPAPELEPADGDPILLAQANWRRSGWDAGPHFLAGLSVVAAEQQIRTAGTPALAPLGLTHARHEALAVLAFSRHGELPLSVLSRQLLLHLTSVTATVDALVRLGFVERVPHPDDRRTTLARITPAGRAAMEESCSRLAELHFGVGALSDAEAVELFRLLAKVRRSSAASTPICQPRADADAAAG